MRQTNFALALLVAAALAACGNNGSTGGDQTLKVKFSSQVTFGDSLADVGTYAVGTVKDVGGGKYTINGNSTTVNASLTGKNWTELMAAQFGLAAPCAAQTGLDGDPSKGFSIPVVNHTGCFGYAQGGARVTNLVGPGHKLTGSVLGQLTVPVSIQIANHLAVSGGKFKGDEVVFVMAGGNDALMQLGQLSAAATAAGEAAGAAKFGSTLVGLLAAGATDPASAAVAIGTAMQTEAARPGHTDASVVQMTVGTAAVQPGNSAVADPAVHGPMIVSAQTQAVSAGGAAGAKYASDNGPAAVVAMATAGAELAGMVKTLIVAKGANHVVVNNLPDVAISPSALRESSATQALIGAMVKAFNDKLKEGIAGEAKVLYVDLFSVSHDQATNPTAYGLTNTTKAACGANALGTTSLACNGSNLIGGDVSHYMFADDVHPTPFEYSLIAQYVSAQMIIKGWL